MFSRAGRQGLANRDAFQGAEQGQGSCGPGECTPVVTSLRHEIGQDEKTSTRGKGVQCLYRPIVFLEAEARERGENQGDGDGRQSSEAMSQYKVQPGGEGTHGDGRAGGTAYR